MYSIALFFLIIYASITPLALMGHQNMKGISGPSIEFLEFHTNMSLADQIVSLQNGEIDIVSNCFDDKDFVLANTDNVAVS